MSVSTLPLLKPPSVNKQSDNSRDEPEAAEDSGECENEQSSVGINNVAMIYNINNAGGIGEKIVLVRSKYDYYTRPKGSGIEWKTANDRRKATSTAGWFSDKTAS